MERILEDFIVTLRNNGVRISISESIDAANVLKFIGYSQKSILRDSLASVLAKSLDEKVIFYGCFEDFFEVQGMAHNSPDSKEKGSEGKETEKKESKEKEAKNNNIPVDQKDSALTKLLLSDDMTSREIAIREAARSIDIRSIQYFTQKGRYMARIMNHLGDAALFKDIQRLLKENTAKSTEKAKSLQVLEKQLFGAVKAFVEKHFTFFASSSTDKIIEKSLRETSLSKIGIQDLNIMRKIVNKITKRLNSLYSRKRKTARRGQLDFKKTLRENIAYQGVLFNISWKYKKIDRPDIIAVCDISRSVQSYVQFLLLFLYSLSESFARIKTFIFCSNLVEVSNIFDNYPLEEALKITESGKGLDIIMGSTDYGQAFQDLKKGWLDIITNKTFVLILGDGRNNFADNQSEILTMIYKRCKRLIWLNPESRFLWNSGDSEMKSYLPSCHMAMECNTINHLERVADHILSYR